MSHLPSSFQEFRMNTSMTSVPRTTSPSGVRGTEHQPRFVSVAEWVAKYGKRVSS